MSTMPEMQAVKVALSSACVARDGAAFSHAQPVRTRLAGPTDLAGFRQAARRLFAEGIPPEMTTWEVADAPRPGETASLWGDAPDVPQVHGVPHPPDVHGVPGRPDHPTKGTAATPQPLRMPRAFVALCEEVILHRDPGRLGLLYRLLWRLGHEPALRHDPLDADMMQAGEMARAVRRDIHKMRAFVRFRPVGEHRHVAWFEPAHHIVEANAPFFMRRFAQMRWAILTPDRCVEWDGRQLTFQPGADAHAAPKPDAGEALWLTYYEHIFNPARLKLATMTREMPRRYWPNLPEATLIRTLADGAQSRSHAMLAAEPGPERVIRLIDMPRRAASTAPDTPTLQPPSWPASATVAPSDFPRVRTLTQLREATQVCRNCPIGAGATQSVCGEGPMKPALMFVGEQPGDQEDLAGRPFVGPAGRLLDKAMAQLGWPRNTIYVTNAVKHFKYEVRGTRRLHKTPGQREMEACSHWLEQEIAMVKPTRLVALGATAARALLGRQVPIMQMHGQWIEERADGRPVMVTWHPSALLRMPEGERTAAFERWVSDLAKAQKMAAS